MTNKLINTVLQKTAMIIIISFVFITACTKHETYSVIPEIEYKSFDKIPTSTGIDNKAYLTISFTDGDGDIGLNPEDTFPPYNANSPYYYNFIIDYYELQNDSFVKIDLPLTNNSRIPYVDANLAERGIKGEITIELFFNNIMSTSDSIRYEIYIFDRALHKSNVIMTPSIYVKKSP
jgi:hypothetical protein